MADANVTLRPHSCKKNYTNRFTFCLETGSYNECSMPVATESPKNSHCVSPEVGEEHGIIVAFINLNAHEDAVLAFGNHRKLKNDISRMNFIRLNASLKNRGGQSFF